MRDLNQIEVLKAQAAKRADHNHHWKIAELAGRTTSINFLKKRNQSLLNLVPFVLRDMAGEDNGDFFGGRVYSLKELVLIGRAGSHGQSVKKTGSVSA